MKRSRVIAFMNNKGGIGKTTQAFNLAKHYLRNERVVACVDFDQQEQLQTLLPEITRSDVKAEDLAEIEANYVIVDTGPTFSMEHIDLMDAADVILIPVQLESLDMEQSLKLLRTVKRTGHHQKTRIIVTHSGKHTLMYKSLMPALQSIADEFEIEILCEMRKSQAVAQATLQKKTVFEIQSPPEVRKEFKELYKSIGRSLSEITPSGVLAQKENAGESCHAH